MADADVTARVGALEQRVQELSAVQDLVLRLLSTTRPLSRLLEQYGATETQEKALYQLFDELVVRVRGPERDRPTFGYLQMQLGHIFPELAREREFLQLLIDTLKIERPAYRTLHAYAVEQRWPT